MCDQSALFAKGKIQVLLFTCCLFIGFLCLPFCVPGGRPLEDGAKESKGLSDHVLLHACRAVSE